MLRLPHLSATLATLPVAGCSLIVPGPDDFTYGTDAGVGMDAGLDAGDTDSGPAVDSGDLRDSGDSGDMVDAGPCGMCSGDTPVCDTTAGDCVRCVTNEQCDDGDICTVDRCALDNTCSSVPDDTCIAEVDSGGAHACARRATGRIACWGLNVYEQLGVPSAGADSAYPLTVPGVNDATDLSAGARHTCVVRATGEVACWGWNSAQQLGNGMTVDSATPVLVPMIDDATQVTAGQFHTCALRSTGRVWCWGRNSDGQLGSGATGADSGPVEVVDLTDAVEVAAGELHTCARRAGGQMACWGANWDGQLGDGTTTGSPRPVAVPGLSDLVSITASAFHSCAVRATGQVLCWGFNGTGRLGDGSDVDSLVPVMVSGGRRRGLGERLGGKHVCRTQLRCGVLLG